MYVRALRRRRLASQRYWNLDAVAPLGLFVEIRETPDIALACRQSDTDSLTHKRTAPLLPAHMRFGTTLGGCPPQKRPWTTGSTAINSMRTSGR